MPPAPGATRWPGALVHETQEVWNEFEAMPAGIQMLTIAGDPDGLARVGTKTLIVFDEHGPERPSDFAPRQAVNLARPERQT